MLDHCEQMQQMSYSPAASPFAEVSVPQRLTPPGQQVTPGQEVYDAEGVRLGRITARFPAYVLVERGWVFPRVYYVPRALIRRVEGVRVFLLVSEATLVARGYRSVPDDLYQDESPSGVVDIAGVSLLGKYPLTPAETGHYYSGPHSPGINTDASGSYAPYEIDPWGQPAHHPIKLYTTATCLAPRVIPS
jgi:hypothetical protein